MTTELVKTCLLPSIQCLVYITLISARTSLGTASGHPYICGNQMLDPVQKL